MIAAERGRSAPDDSGLAVTLDRPLPSELPAGRASAVFLAGSCFHPRLAVEDLTIIAGGVRHRPAAQRMPRPDLFWSVHPTLPMTRASSAGRDPESPLDPELRSYRSGFWGTVPIEAQPSPGHLELSVEARLADGTIAAAQLGRIAVVDAPGPATRPELRTHSRRPLIAICMATFDPDMELFRIQIESIRAQTDQDWICLISDDHSKPERFDAIAETVGDDERFVLSRADEHLGFYRNFERALEMVPVEAELIALSDHDDRWYPDKLAALREAIGSAELVYSDLRRVDPAGNVRAETLWENRRNNRTSLASLLISNTIPGAACMFRRRVLDTALPFPAGPGWNFHDHWLALTAMALGELAYVERPLYDYVQHAGAVLGRVAAGKEAPRPGRPRRLRAVLELRRGFLERWRSAYFSAYLQRELLAQTLLARVGPALPTRKRRALRLLVASARSPLAFAWLAARPLRALVRLNETLGVESTLARGIVWRYAIVVLSWKRERPGRTQPDASLPSFNPRNLGAGRRRWLASR